MLSRFIFKQIIAPDLFLQIIDSDDFLFANCLFRSLSVTHFVNCHQGRRVASILERRCGSEDESRTIWPHAFHIWSCSEASIRRFWGIKVFSFVKMDLPEHCVALKISTQQLRPSGSQRETTKGVASLQQSRLTGHGRYFISPIFIFPGRMIILEAMQWPLQSSLELNPNLDWDFPSIERAWYEW